MVSLPPVAILVLETLYGRPPKELEKQQVYTEVSPVLFSRLLHAAHIYLPLWKKGEITN